MEAKDNIKVREDMGQGKAQAISGGISEAVGSFAGFWAASSAFAIKASPLLLAPLLVLEFFMVLVGLFLEL